MGNHEAAGVSSERRHSSFSWTTPANSFAPGAIVSGLGPWPSGIFHDSGSLLWKACGLPGFPETRHAARHSCFFASMDDCYLSVRSIELESVAATLGCPPALSTLWETMVVSATLVLLWPALPVPVLSWLNICLSYRTVRMHTPFHCEGIRLPWPWIRFPADILPNLSIQPICKPIHFQGPPQVVDCLEHGGHQLPIAGIHVCETMKVRFLVGHPWDVFCH